MTGKWTAISGSTRYELYEDEAISRRIFNISVKGKIDAGYLVLEQTPNRVKLQAQGKKSGYIMQLIPPHSDIDEE